MIAYQNVRLIDIAFQCAGKMNGYLIYRDLNGEYNFNEPPLTKEFIDNQENSRADMKKKYQRLYTSPPRILMTLLMTLMMQRMKARIR